LRHSSVPRARTCLNGPARLASGQESKGRFGEAPVTGAIKGNQVTLSVTGSAEGQEIKMDYTGTVDGDAMAGKVVFGAFGEGTFKGTRARPPQP
jgi:hypothetical protein